MMLIHRHDEPLTDTEWRDFLKTHDFGDFIVPGAPTRDLPVVVPTHFIWDGDKTVLLHLARINPVWKAIEERPRALLSVFGAPGSGVPGYARWEVRGIHFGQFLADLISFLIVALAIFLLMVKVVGWIARFSKGSQDVAPTEKECPYCLMKIPVKAIKCAHCTADLNRGAESGSSLEAPNPA